MNAINFLYVWGAIDTIVVDFYTFEGSFIHLRDYIHLRVQQGSSLEYKLSMRFSCGGELKYLYYNVKCSLVKHCSLILLISFFRLRMVNCIELFYTDYDNGWQY